MARKTRKDYKTQEVTYEELYCDECSRLVDDLYPVSFAGLEEEEWCRGCIGERVSRFNKARIKMEDLLERTDKKLMSAPSENKLFCIYLIITTSIGAGISYTVGGTYLQMLIMAVMAPMYAMVGTIGTVIIGLLLILLILISSDIIKSILS